MFKSRGRKAPNAPRGKAGEDAVFVGWQKTPWGNTLPLYSVLKTDHPSYQSTVTEKTLLSLKLRIPWTPSPFPGMGPTPRKDPGSTAATTVTAQEFLEDAGIDYTVVTMPLQEGVKVDPSHSASDRWATVRTDTGEVLGTVGEHYTPIQNADAFTFFDRLVATHEATYETAGTIGRGECTWILAQLPGYINVHNNDIVGKYLLLSNNHDGTSRVRAKLTPIRVICNNTLSAALMASGEIPIHRTTTGAEADAEAASLLKLSNTMYNRLDTIFSRMALTKISDKQLLDYVTALVPDSDQDQEDNAKNEEIRKAFLELHESGQGADLSRGTLWGAFNCVTEYTDHAMEADPGTRLQSIWFGRGEQLKRKAFQLAERMM